MRTKEQDKKVYFIENFTKTLLQNRQMQRLRTMLHTYLCKTFSTCPKRWKRIWKIAIHTQFLFRFENYRQRWFRINFWMYTFRPENKKVQSSLLAPRNLQKIPARRIIFNGRHIIFNLRIQNGTDCSV